MDIQPAWSADDRWIVFGSNREDGVSSIWRQTSDGTGTPERLTLPPFPSGAPSVTPDGRHLLFAQLTANGDGDIAQLTLGTTQVAPLLRSRFSESGPQVSPDGRWLAYGSDRSGMVEVYVQPYPNSGDARWQVSTGGGRTPAWARNGRELFYMSPDNALMGVTVRATGSTWRAEQPVKVLAPGYWSRPNFIGRNYDPAPDGRFLVLGPPPRAPNPPDLVVVQHWDEELRARVPSK